MCKVLIFKYNSHSSGCPTLKSWHFSYKNVEIIVGIIRVHVEMLRSFAKTLAVFCALFESVCLIKVLRMCGLNR